MNRIVYVNNTSEDIRDFHGVFTKCVLESLPLPEEIADIFDMKIINVDGAARGIVNFK